MVKLFTVDAFTNKPFCGNPAAVCLVENADQFDNQIMQNIATEMNLSETAFVTIDSTKGVLSFKDASHFGLRWFTPANEVPLCGHATLASAKVLFSCIGNENKILNFNTLSGVLSCTNSDAGEITLNFPQFDILTLDNPIVKSIQKAVVGEIAVKEVKYGGASKKLLIVLGDQITKQQVEQLKPNFVQMLEIHPIGDIVRGVIVSARASGDKDAVDSEGMHYDFVSRYFAPWVGINEDPVTGSAHCVLGPYWSSVFGKSKLYACQCSKRVGELNLELLDNKRINISGQAVVVIDAELNL